MILDLHVEQNNSKWKKYKQPSDSLDREQLAKTISNIIVQIPNINDASVLVTDEEVLSRV